MTDQLIAVEVNCETGETIERPFTAAEVKAYQDAQVKAQADKVAEDKAKADKATARKALLERLQMTEEDAALLLA